jgi:choline dehydrogenase
MEEYDYVVIGAGAAGSVIASRLADAGHAVCVVEAGAEDRNVFIRMPAGFVKTIANPELVWPFATEPGYWTGDRSIPLPQGRVVGGSGAINGMLFVRGQPQDFDDWEKAGAEGWGYRDLLPCFRRLERRLGDDPDRGRDGPQPVTDPCFRHPLSDAFIAAAVTTGLPRNQDYNSGDQAGVGAYQLSIEKGRRVTSARAWLRARVRTGKIRLITEALVTRISIRDRRATGIVFEQDGIERAIAARREIILSAGAINSPRLLMLSQIGPAATLGRAGIAPIAVREGVGRNLRDHYTARIVARIDGAKTINNLVNAQLSLGYQVLRWLAHFPSLLGTGPAAVGAFGASGAEGARPDYMLMFAPASYREGHVGKLDLFAGVTCGAWQLRPGSSGEVRVTSPDPHDAPLVQPNYLAVAGDRAVLLAALRHQRRILSAPPMQRYAPVEVLPGEDCISDDELLDFARRRGNTSYHPVGTCRIGRSDDPLAVVDARLRVIGIERLRVVDASVMPMITSGNTYAPTLAIAERAADLVLADARSQLAP